MDLPHPILVDVARDAINAAAVDSARARAQGLLDDLFRQVINATGILVHTNLGRAPYEVRSAGGYSNLELDLSTGARGSRQQHAGWLIAKACGAEAAMVVNNGAAAVMLVLAALARKEAVAVSRGELIQLGGGFRLPDVLEESGASLVEVGTTNRTNLSDYQRAVENKEVALVLKVHQSNYRIVGFVESVSPRALASLEVPLVVDLGSGLLDAHTPWIPNGPPSWLANEPAVRQTLAEGADIVTFSGDKLLGGPQAGIIAGRRDLVERCAAHPLARALRPGDAILWALQDVFIAYLDGRADLLPFWQMATASVQTLRVRADTIAEGVSGVIAVSTESLAGGGTTPGSEIPSWGLEIDGDRRRDLRRSAPFPIISRVRDRRTILDLRTVEPEQDVQLTRALSDLAR